MKVGIHLLHCLSQPSAVIPFTVPVTDVGLFSVAKLDNRVGLSVIGISVISWVHLELPL